MGSLFEKLKALGVERGNEKKTFKKKDKVDLSRVLGGEWIENQYGRTLLIHQEFPEPYTQGNIPIAETTIKNSLAPLLNIQEGFNQSTSICFFDTETSSLSLGVGSFVFLCGFSSFNEAGNLCVDQFFLPHPADEKAFIYAIQEFLTRFSHIASYNGKSFDIPMLKSRYVLNNLDDNSLEKEHIDLLFIARSLWKRRLDNCRLVSIEENILNFHRSDQEVDGWLVPILYQDYLQDGNPEPLKRVCYHNTHDVISLTALLQVLIKIFQEKGSVVAEEVEDILSLAYFYEKKEEIVQAEAHFVQYFQQIGPVKADSAVLYDYAWMQRRRENWEDAVTHWQQAADQDHYPSMIELAKYYEHQEKDMEKAIYWLEKVKKAHDKGFDLVKDDLDRRDERLLRKKQKYDQEKPQKNQ